LRCTGFEFGRVSFGLGSESEGLIKSDAVATSIVVNVNAAPDLSQQKREASASCGRASVPWLIFISNIISGFATGMTVQPPTRLPSPSPLAHRHSPLAHRTCGALTSHPNFQVKFFSVFFQKELGLQPFETNLIFCVTQVVMSSARAHFPDESL
jgi:hypothetical protein